jgi:acyl-coenzyme A synthetase/AMP-(fatty) acid ligase
MTNLINQLFATPVSQTIATNLGGDQQITQTKFVEDVYKLRSLLCDYSERRWLVTYDNSYLFIVGVFALISLNKPVVISANRKSSWLSEIDQSFDAVLGESPSEINTKKDKVCVTLPELDSMPASKAETLQITGDEYLVFFTSGSTGKPKEVVKLLSYITNEVHTLEQTFGQSLAKVNFSSSVSHFHIYGLLFNLFWPLLTRRVFITEIIEFQEQLLELDKRPSEYVFVSSPAFLSRLETGMQMSESSLVFSSGGPLSLDSASNAQTVFGNLPSEVYGSTETGGIGFRKQSHLNQAWQLFKGVELIIRDSQAYIQSAHFDKNSEQKLDDNIELLDSEHFVLTGRNDRIVKIEEKRVSLTEIEAFLDSLNQVSESACVVIQGKRTIIGAVIVLNQQGERELDGVGRLKFFQKMRAYMRNRFENVTIPRKWRVVSEMPVNQQSKREYTELKALFKSS